MKGPFIVHIRDLPITRAKTKASSSQAAGLPVRYENASRAVPTPCRLSFCARTAPHPLSLGLTFSQKCLSNGAKRPRHALNPHFSHLNQDAFLFSDRPSSLASTGHLKLLVGKKEHIGAFALKASTSVIWRTHAVGPIVL